ncbi:TIGR04222 domain-containing membrane protein [Kitasatospora sp. NPDC058115]|uniref:TIGR04222 domain-containing membrane protein n=1 Tax=Kitasatospora sp. NPDC058115 TaxID=3346347 RepID=UPI0036DEE7D8
MPWWVLLVAAYGLGVVCAVRYRRALRVFLHTPVRTRPPDEEFTLYEVAFLEFQEQRVAEVAMAAMVLGGRLTVRDKVITVVDPEPRDAVEAAVLKVIGRSPRSRMWRRTGRFGRSRAIVAIGDGLGDQGLTRHPGRSRAAERRHNLLVWAQVPCLAMGLTATALAADEGGRLFLVPLVATAVLLAAVWKAAHPEVSGHYWRSHRTEAGRAALEAHFARHRPWRPATNDDLSPQDAELLAAVLPWGSFRGRLAPLSGALRRPERPRTGGTPVNDPPGLGGL